MSTSDDFKPNEQLRAVPTSGLKEAVILLPDISGFTNFVSTTAIEHSGHIISELLETVIDANELDLELSEIEGDALLFYRFGTIPTPEEIEQQSRKMFEAFHLHLLSYETQRVCNCGACSTANNLTLKVIAHAGGLSTMHIKGRTKLLGPDIIVAHRLLKNDINSDEYLLLSDGWQQASGTWEVGETAYTDLGAVKYRYQDLGYLKESLSAPNTDERKFNRINNPPNVTRRFSVPKEELLQVVSDIGRRPEWISGLSTIDVSSDPLQRVGASHICVLNGTKHNIEAYSVINAESGAVELSELNRKTPVLGETIFTISVNGDEQASSLQMEVHPQNPGILAKLLLKLGRKVFEKQMSKSMDNLQQLLA